jgi:hypothetical protein
MDFAYQLVRALGKQTPLSVTGSLYHVGDGRPANAIERLMVFVAWLFSPTDPS